MAFVRGQFLVILLATAATLASQGNSLSSDIDIREMAEVKDELYVLKRKHTQYTRYRCQSARMVANLSDTELLYLLRARVRSKHFLHYVEANVTVNLFPTRRDKSKYAARYVDKQTGNEVTMRLKTMDKRKSCFVVLVKNSGNRKGCELLQTASSLGEPVPKVCEKYYNRECRGKSIRLYLKNCK